MGFTFVLSNLGVIPADGVPAYDVVWAYLVPLAIPLLLFRADLRRILREAGPTLLAFADRRRSAPCIGTIVAFKLVPLGEEGWKLAASSAATYIGGSMNYAAAAEAVELRSGDLLSAGVAADNLVMALYFLVLFALPSRRLVADAVTSSATTRWPTVPRHWTTSRGSAAALPDVQGASLALASPGPVRRRLRPGRADRLARQRHPDRHRPDGDPGHGLCPARFASWPAPRSWHLPDADLLRRHRRQRQRPGGAEGRARCCSSSPP